MRVQSATRPYSDQRFISAGSPPTVRYTITKELWETLTVEQIDKQMARLAETRRLKSYSIEADLTLRVPVDAILQKAWGLDDPMNDDRQQWFLDFEFREGRCQIEKTRFYTRHKAPECYSMDEKRRFPSKYFDLLRSRGKIEIEGPWWERDHLCARYELPKEGLEAIGSDTALVAMRALIVLFIDRNVQKVVVEPRPPSKLRKLSIGKPRPPTPDDGVHEITLYVPARTYTGIHGGTHASPRMHYRAEHVRRQPYGPRSAPLYKDIVIEAQWINADDVDPNEPRTPILRSYKLTA